MKLRSTREITRAHDLVKVALAIRGTHGKPESAWTDDERMDVASLAVLCWVLDHAESGSGFAARLADIAEAVRGAVHDAITLAGPLSPDGRADQPTADEAARRRKAGWN